MLVPLLPPGGRSEAEVMLMRTGSFWAKEVDRKCCWDNGDRKKKRSQFSVLPLGLPLILRLGKVSLGAAGKAELRFGCASPTIPEQNRKGWS